MQKSKISIASLALLAAALAIAIFVLAVPEPNPKSALPPQPHNDAQKLETIAGYASQTSSSSSAPDSKFSSGRGQASQSLASASSAPHAGRQLPSAAGSVPASGHAGSVGSAASAHEDHGDQKPSAQSTSSGVGSLGISSPYRSPAEILAGRNLADPQQRALVVAEMTAAENARYAAVRAKAENLGLPVKIDGPMGGLAILHDFRGNEPLYRGTLNANAAISTGANLIRQASPYNLTGSGLKVGVWDGGSVRNTHQEFDTTRVVRKNTNAPFDDHATHVAGTIGARGIRAAAKGMAPFIAIDSYDWSGDYAEMTAAGAASATDNPATKIPVSNHSYGAANPTVADMGRYEADCNSTDALLAALPHYLAFWAAGNEQDDPVIGRPFSGYQTITFNGLAKNVMTVGAANDAVTAGIRDVSKGLLASFSSMGPCDDGRIKPDIVANGVGLYSCVSSNNNISYDTYDGTSMATPNAAGSAALLQQLYRPRFGARLMPASMLKALIIHTADDMGRPGPDYQYGWGYMNVKAAADLILAHKADPSVPKLFENTVTSSAKVRTTSVTWDGVSPIRATLVWTDPPGAAQTASNSRTPNLVNDLDLKVVAPDGSTTYLPYVMPFVGSWTSASMTANATKGTNKVDNVECVDIPAPTQTGTYTVHVGLYGTNRLTGADQPYSLVVTAGAVPVPTPAPPPPTNASSLAVIGDLTFPPVRVGFPSLKSLSVVNQGDSPVAVTSAAFTNPVFSVNQTAFNLPARSAIALLVSFKPSAAGSYTDALALSVGGSLALSVPCSGSATVPVQPPTNSPSLTIVGDLNFPAVRIGLSTQKVVSLQNRGTTPVSVTSIALSNPVFSVNRSSLILPARSAASLVVTFRPTVATNYADTLNISVSGSPSTTLPCIGRGFVLDP